MDQDYSFLEEDITDNKTVLSELMVCVNATISIDKQIEEHEKTLKELKEKRDKLGRDILPNYLLKNKVRDIELENGVSVSIKEEVYASIPKEVEKAKKSVRWLFRNGGGDIVKDTLTVIDPEEELVKALESKGIEYEREYAVNSRTLSSWFKDALGITKNAMARIKEEDIPKELSFFRTWKTTIGGSR